MKKYFLLINVIIGFGCSSTVEPNDFIPSETMVELLIEIHILEARVDKLRLTKDSAYSIYNSFEKEVFDKYEVDKVQYENSYKYYLSNPTLLDQIYTVVVDSLNVIQKRGYQEDTELAEVEMKGDIKGSAIEVNKETIKSLNSRDSINALKNDLVRPKLNKSKLDK